MTQKTLTRADLSNSVYREIGLSLSESTQLVDAVRKFLADWKIAGGSVDAFVEEAAERNEFRVQAPFEIYVTPFPLVLHYQTCNGCIHWLHC